MKKAKLIIVTGMVATGKSTLSIKIADELRVPFFSMDNFKEKAFDVLGAKDRVWSVQLGVLSFDLLFLVAERILKSGKSVVIESTFDPEYSSKKISGLMKKYNFDCVQVRLYADPAIIYRRFEERAKSGNRHPGHVDQTILRQTKNAIFARNGTKDRIPINCSFLDIDTSDFKKIDLTQIVSFIKSH